MIIPAAMNIYSAQDTLKHRTQDEINDELKELRSSNANGTFEDGYLLALEVARVILAGEPQIYQAGLKPGDLL